MNAGWILGLDTATRATAVALDGADGSVLEARDDPPRGQRPAHAARLLPLCAGLLGQAGIAFSELERLAVGVGPGTFTGLRIGVATARALAGAAAVPLVGVSTLQALALNARSDADSSVDAVAAVLDARRGEAFAAAWSFEELGRLGSPLIEAAAFTPQSLGERLSGLGRSILAIGEGAIEFRSVLERSGASVPEDTAPVHRVSAAGHCFVARHVRAADPAHVTPQYLRLPDAEIARRAKDTQ